MSNKTFREMKKEFIVFYKEKILPIKKDYENEAEKQKKVLNKIKKIIFSFIITELIIIITFLLSIQQFASSNIHITLIFLFMFIFGIHFCMIIKTSTIDTKNLNYVKTYCIEENIYNKIINIFLSNTLINKISYKPLFSHNEYDNTQKFKKNRVKEFNSSNIFNYAPHICADNFIQGTYNDTKIRIFKLSTENSFNIFLWKIVTITIKLIVCTLIILIFLNFEQIKLIFFSLTFILFIYCIFVALYYKLTSFKGVVIEFDFNKNISDAEIIFHEESIKSLLIPFNREKFKKVNLESINFENYYNLFCTDQIVARRIFTPQYMEKIERIRNVFDSNYIRGIIKNNKLILAINTSKNLLSINDVVKNEDLICFYKEMISILKLIEYIKFSNK